MRLIELISKNFTKKFWLDYRFAIALLAGPMVWLTFYALGNPVSFFRLEFVNYLLPVFIYPVLEEWVFRGNLQPYVASYCPQKRFFYPVSLANLITSVCFASLHLFSHPPLWAAAIILPSLVFGWAMERYKTLTAPIILHIFYNAGYFLFFA